MCPKVVLSTIAYSPLIPPDRIPPDLIMRLWAGGLYGLNRLCKAALGQAAGAVVGACLARQAEPDPRPVVGMTSLGSSALSYMKKLKPALEARGYELAVFHTTGMGGRAFEDLAHRGYFACVMDFSLAGTGQRSGGQLRERRQRAAAGRGSRGRAADRGAGRDRHGRFRGLDALSVAGLRSAARCTSTTA